MSLTPSLLWDKPSDSWERILQKQRRRLFNIKKCKRLLKYCWRQPELGRPVCIQCHCSLCHSPRGIEVYGHGWSFGICGRMSGALPVALLARCAFRHSEQPGVVWDLSHGWLPECPPKELVCALFALVFLGVVEAIQLVVVVQIILICHAVPQRLQ